MSLERLNAIVKERSTTGAQPIPHGGRIGHLAGIPVMFDATLPARAWQLVETATGNVVEEGRGDRC